MNLDLPQDEPWFTRLLAKVPDPLHPAITTMAFRRDFYPLFKTTTLRVTAYLKDRLLEVPETQRGPLKTPKPADELRWELESVFRQLGKTTSENYVAMAYLLFAIVELGFEVAWPKNVSRKRGALVSTFNTNFPCKAVIKQIQNIRRAP